MSLPSDPQFSASASSEEQLSLPVSPEEAAAVIPFARLGHATFVTQSRPAALTVVGIIGILVAAVATLVCLWGLFMCFAASMLTHFPAAMGSQPTVQGAMTLPNQLTTSATLVSLQTLSAAQQQTLSDFLQQRGDQAFPSAGGALSAAAIRLDVLKINVENNPTTTPNSAPAVIFVLASGTLRVADDSTQFTPVTTTSTSTPDAGTGTDPSGAATTANVPAWNTAGSASIAQTFIASVQQKIAPAKLSLVQLQALNTQFTPSPSNPSPLPPAANIDTASLTPNGDLIVVWSNLGSTSSIVIDAAGKTNGTTVGSNLLANFTQKTSPGMIQNATIAVTANILLQIFLFVISIMALSGSRRIRWPLFAYAVCQIGLAIWGAIAAADVFNIFNRTTTTANSPAVVMFAIVTATLASAYPITLFFLLNLKRVREYAASGIRVRRAI